MTITPDHLSNDGIPVRPARQNLPSLIIVTPTYPRPLRIRYLRRLAKAFAGIPNFLWLVVEDGESPASDVQLLLRQSGIDHCYLNAGPSNDSGNKQRNCAIAHIKEHRLSGIVYFADDDNVFEKKLFTEIRKTRKISIFPVGNLGPRGIERPIVKNGQIVGWDADWTERKFPIDMAGFAIHADLLHSKNEKNWFRVWGGETEFLELFINDPSELEVLCDHCRHCYAWHDQPLGEPIVLAKMKMRTRNVLKPIIRKVRNHLRLP